MLGYWSLYADCLAGKLLTSFSRLNYKKESIHFSLACFLSNEIKGTLMIEKLQHQSDISIISHVCISAEATA